MNTNNAILHFLTTNAWGSGSDWFWAMAQTALILLSLIMVIPQLMAQRHSNTLTVLKNMRDDWESDAMIAARIEVCANFGSEDKTIRHIEERVLGFFESLGVWQSKGVFSRRVVWEYYSYFIEHYWPILQPRVLELRRSTKDESWYRNFERLHRQMRIQSFLCRSPWSVKSDAEMKRFIVSERAMKK